MSTTVHPRACGERFCGGRCGCSEDGSSPRVRGTEHLIELARFRNRFIPARAGNGRSESRRQLEPPVHPRACGERPTWPLRSLYNVGSSPRVRGTDCEDAFRVSVRRFIPARAGNGTWLKPASGTPTVHPRACGERFHSSTGTLRIDGSSPRVRGTGEGITRREAEFRFIPARAGNGPSSQPHRSFGPVHPRACGERTPRTACGAAHVGSSPRVRGTD